MENALHRKFVLVLTVFTKIRMVFVLKMNVTYPQQHQGRMNNLSALVCYSKCSICYENDDMFTEYLSKFLAFVFSRIKSLCNC